MDRQLNTAGFSAETFSKSFSKTFSKWVSAGLFLRRTSYLILLENSHIFDLEIGRESPDSDPRLQLQTSCFSMSCRNQRKQVPVKLPVKIQLAKTQ